MIVMITTAFQFFTVLLSAAAFALLAVSGTAHAVSHFELRFQRSLDAREDQL